MFGTNVPQRLRRPENLETKATYARRKAIVNNYRNRNAWQKVKPIPVKRIAVRKAYREIREVSAEFKVPCVKKTVDEKIVRVCCRTIKHLDNIGMIIKELMKLDLIMEIGMPLEYSYKMKSLVLFIKPKTKSLIIEKVFQKCTVRYPYCTVVDEDPSVAAEKKLNELEVNDSVQEVEKAAATIAQNEASKCMLKSTKKEENETEEVCHDSKIFLFFKYCLIFFSMFLLFQPIACEE